MIIGLVVFVAYLYFFVGSNEIVKVLSHINSVQYIFFYSLTLLSVLGSVFFWSAAWNTILRTLKVHISYRRAYIYYWVGYFVDLVVPCATICGEVTRLYLVQRETKENTGSLAAAAITNRIVAYFVIAVGLYAGAALIFLKPAVSSVITSVFIFFVVGVTVYLGILLYLAFFKQAARNFTRLYLQLEKRFRPKSYNLSNIKNTEKSLYQYYESFKIFRENPRLLVRPLILHTISYTLGLAVYILVFYALGIPSATPEFYIVVFFISQAVQDSSAAFSVGTLDILLATLFLLYGIPIGISGIAAAVVRSASFWFPLFVGFVCVQIVGARNLLSARPEDLRRRMERTRKSMDEEERQRHQEEANQESARPDPSHYL
jgi:uncharacterized protein (TIRG00374 family)